MTDWISVEERLPVHGEWTLVWVPNGDGGQIHYRRFEEDDTGLYPCWPDDSQHWDSYHLYVGEDVTHWAPSPEGPKDG